MADFLASFVANCMDFGVCKKFRNYKDYGTFWTNFTQLFPA